MEAPSLIGHHCNGYPTGISLYIASEWSLIQIIQGEPDNVINPMHTMVYCLDLEENLRGSVWKNEIGR